MQKPWPPCYLTPGAALGGERITHEQICLAGESEPHCKGAWLRRSFAAERYLWLRMHLKSACMCCSRGSGAARAKRTSVAMKGCGRADQTCSTLRYAVVWMRRSKCLAHRSTHGAICWGAMPGQASLQDHVGVLRRKKKRYVMRQATALAKRGFKSIGTEISSAELAPQYSRIMTLPGSVG